MAGAAAVFGAACTPGDYPVDLFKEMHYQGSQRRLEPDRLSAPDGAVSTKGGRPAYTWDEATSLPNQLAGDAQALTRGRALYATNCATCHGVQGRGDGAVAPEFKKAQVKGLAPVLPVDLASQRVQGRTDGQLYWIVTNGLGNMPAFRGLLTDDEVWAVVRFVRGVGETP